MTYVTFGSKSADQIIYRDSNNLINSIILLKFYDLEVGGAINYASSHIDINIRFIEIINSKRNFCVSIIDGANNLCYELFFNEADGTLFYSNSHARDVVSEAVDRSTYLTNLVTLLSTV